MSRLSFHKVLKMHGFVRLKSYAIGITCMEVPGKNRYAEIYNNQRAWVVGGGFGRTPWIQVALALAALAFGTYRSIQTIDSGGVIGLVFIAMVLAWYTYWTWSNFKGRNA